VAGDVKSEKREIRERIWRLLVERGVARPPFPVQGRIPNFTGAEQAAALLVRSRVFQRAEVVFCNPDSPQRPVREAALHYGKLVVMASPRLRSGFLVLDPSRIPRSAYSEAATIKGAFKYGKQVFDSVPSVDLKVAGSVAVSPDGGRVGKGGGFSDLEFAILKELGAVSDDTPIATTVHDLQLVERVPLERHDVPVNLVFTPTRVVEVRVPLKRPEGVYWDLLTPQQIEEIPVLKLLSKRRQHR
jgi:5-formyltetrahydrofolate cyclo-ligase